MLIGGLGTALLHALLVLPFVLDLSLAQHGLPNRSGAGASALASTREPLMTVVFINEVSLSVERLKPIEPQDLVSRGVELPDLAILVLSSDPTPATQADEKPGDVPDPPGHEAAPDWTQHALLYGRYLSQVQARIERAWMRPRSEIGAPRFSCRARISQDSRGNVIDIGLDPCNGTRYWQQSLEAAIRTASPLPAPPDPSVYADRLWLSFHSERFQADGSTSGFEPLDRRTLIAANQSQERESLEHLAERFHGRSQSTDKRNTEVIHLTIIGTPHADASLAKPVPIEPPRDTSDAPQPQ